jgi:hypothetical protein
VVFMFSSVILTFFFVHYCLHNVHDPPTPCRWWMSWCKTWVPSVKVLMECNLSKRWCVALMGTLKSLLSFWVRAFFCIPNVNNNERIVFDACLLVSSSWTPPPLHGSIGMLVDMSSNSLNRDGWCWCHTTSTKEILYKITMQLKNDKMPQRNLKSLMVS